MTFMIYKMVATANKILQRIRKRKRSFFSCEQSSPYTPFEKQIRETKSISTISVDSVDWNKYKLKTLVEGERFTKLNIRSRNWNKIPSSSLSRVAAHNTTLKQRFQTKMLDTSAFVIEVLFFRAKLSSLHMDDLRPSENPAKSA